MNVTVLGVSAVSIITLLLVLAYIKHLQSQLRKHIFRNDKFSEYFKKL